MIETNVVKIICKNCGTTLGIMESSAEVCMHSDDISINRIEYRRK